MEQIGKVIRVYFVKQDSPAWCKIRELCKDAPFKSGQVFPIDDDEFESLKKDILILDIPEGE